ncbi:MAG: class I SAM-dependent methyltransferase [Candidatus Andersenbacteria bacterium]
MVCPSCHQPFYFINPLEPTCCRCRRCAHDGNFVQPSYAGYHQELYLAAPYTRTAQTDPQMRRIIDALHIGQTTRYSTWVAGSVTAPKRSRSAPPPWPAYSPTWTGPSNYPGVKFLAHDGNALPFSDGSAQGVVVSINTIEHLVDPDPLPPLAESAASLKPQGRRVTTANLDFILHTRFCTTRPTCTVDPRGVPHARRALFTAFAEKSSSMFKYHPLNKLTTLVLNPTCSLSASSRAATPMPTPGDHPERTPRHRPGPELQRRRAPARLPRVAAAPELQKC